MLKPETAERVEEPVKDGPNETKSISRELEEEENSSMSGAS